MACGTPVVNTNLDSGVPWVSRHGETGLTVEPGNVEELAAAIRTLLDDPARRQALGAAARARAWSECRDRVLVRRTLDLSGELLRTALPTVGPGLGEVAAATSR
jgi:rhamnosyl/mannosyltransferase